MNHPYQTIEELVNAAAFDDFAASENRVYLTENFDFALNQTRIADHDACNINRKIAVASKHICNGKRQEAL